MLYPLYPIINQFQLKNGALNVGGFLRVYYASRTDVIAPTYEDSDGESQNPEWIELDNNARAKVYVDVAYAYNLFVYDSDKNLLWTQYNMFPEEIASVTVTGMQYVSHDGTLSGDGTTASPLSVIGGGGGGLSTVITKWPVVGNGSTADPVTVKDITLLANDDTLTAYSATVDDQNALVLGVNGDWFTSSISGFQPKSDMVNYVTNNTLLTQVNTLNNKISTKYDTTAFEEVSGTFLTAHQDISMKQDVSGMSAYALSADVYNKTEVDEKLANFGGYQVVEGDESGKPIVETPSTKIIYLVKATSGKTDNYKEWIYNGSDFELIGDTSIDLTNYATTAFVNSAVSGKQDKLTDEQLSAISNVSSKLDTTAFSNVSGTFLTAHQDISNKLDTTAFSDVSGTFLTAHQSLEGYATENFVTGITDNKLDTTAFSTVSGTFLTAHQDISNKLDTTAFSTVSGTFLTAAGDMSASKLEYNGDKITGYNGSAFSAGSNYSAGANIDITDNVISGKDWSNEIESATSGKLDTTAFSDVSGTFLTAHQSLDGLMSADKLEGSDTYITGYNGSAFSAQGGSGGKTYSGVSPIVVDNTENKISADTVDVTYQQLAVDDSLVTTSNSAMIAFGVNTTWLTAYLVEQGFVKN